MDFKLKIDKSGDFDAIEIESKYIKELNFVFDSPDNVESKSSDMSGTFTLKGIVGEDTYKSTKNILEWSKLPSSHKNVNRVVTLYVYSGGGKVAREIIFPNAFVVDYEEKFTKKDAECTFELKVRQRTDRFDDIKIKADFDKEEA